MSDYNDLDLENIPPSNQKVIQHIYDLCINHDLKLKYDKEDCEFCIEQFIGDLIATETHNYKLTKYCKIIRSWLETVNIIDDSRIKYGLIEFENMINYKRENKIPDKFLIGSDGKLII